MVLFYQDPALSQELHSCGVPVSREDLDRFRLSCGLVIGVGEDFSCFHLFVLIIVALFTKCHSIFYTEPKIRVKSFWKNVMSM